MLVVILIIMMMVVVRKFGIDGRDSAGVGTLVVELETSGDFGDVKNYVVFVVVKVAAMK